MQITFKPYRRRDGSFMLYINGSNGASAGISPERGWAPYGKGVTQGMRNAVNAALATFEAHAVPFTGDLAAHQPDEQVRCGNYVLTWTDTATIGGMVVSEDGAYLVRDGLILRCGTYDEPVRAREDV